MGIASIGVLFASLISLIVNLIPFIIVVVVICVGIISGIFKGIFKVFRSIGKDILDAFSHKSDTEKNSSVLSLSDIVKNNADDFNLKKRGIDTSNFSKKEIGKTKPFMVFISIVEILLLSALIVGIVCAFKEHQIGLGIISSLIMIYGVIAFIYGHLCIRYRLSKKNAKRYKEEGHLFKEKNKAQKAVKSERHSIFPLSDTAKRNADTFNLNKRGIDTSNLSKKEIGKTKPFMVFLFLNEIALTLFLIMVIIFAFEDRQIAVGIICSLLVIFAVIGLRYFHLNIRYRLSKKDTKRYKELSSQTLK